MQVEIEPDASLWVERSGSGPVVALAHGFTLDHRMWQPQLEAFSKSHTVIRYDMRGFGRSSMPLPGAEYSQARNLAMLLDRLGIARTALIGLSYGGWVALEFALLFPERVSALVTVDSGLQFYRYTK